MVCNGELADAMLVGVRCRWMLDASVDLRARVVEAELLMREEANPDGSKGPRFCDESISTEGGVGGVDEVERDRRPVVSSAWRSFSKEEKKRGWGMRERRKGSRWRWRQIPGDRVDERQTRGRREPPRCHASAAAAAGRVRCVTLAPDKSRGNEAWTYWASGRGCVRGRGKTGD